MLKYLVTVFEHSYEDDWKDGQVDKTYSFEFLQSERFETLKEAVDWFRENYVGEHTLFVDGNSYRIDFTMVPGEFGWHVPTVTQIAAWKRGERHLWNVEYEMKVQKVEDADEKELLTVEGVEKG